MNEAQWASEHRIRGWIGIAILLLWIASLVLPALYVRFDPSGPDVQLLPGYKVLAMGWIAMVGLQPGWLANPLLGALLFVWWRGRVSVRTVRRLAGALAIVSLATIDLVLRPRFWNHEGFGIGYGLWMAANLAAATIVWFRTGRRPTI